MICSIRVHLIRSYILIKYILFYRKHRRAYTDTGVGMTGACGNKEEAQLFGEIVEVRGSAHEYGSRVSDRLEHWSTLY